jgi:hypothetical protein
MLDEQQERSSTMTKERFPQAFYQRCAAYYKSHQPGCTWDQAQDAVRETDARVAYAYSATEAIEQYQRMAPRMTADELFERVLQYSREFGVSFEQAGMGVEEFASEPLPYPAYPHGKPLIMPAARRGSPIWMTPDCGD